MTRKYDALVAGFSDELGLEKTADMETAFQGLLIGGALGTGLTLGGAKLIVHLVKKNKNFAALIGGLLGATLGAGAGGFIAEGAAPPAGPQTIQGGPYAGLPTGTRYTDIVT